MHCTATGSTEFWKGHEVTYQPQPIDTSGVVLPVELAQLTELLAKNAHDIWARGRMAEGWTYGPARDDGAKKHPDLIPYEGLPESEKEYDRQTATETLKAIMTLGYRVVIP